MYTDVSKLQVHQKSHKLVLKVYAITKEFPKEEQFGLTSQMRRAAVSVPSNISEGKARGSNKDYRRFLLMSRGSLAELTYQLLLAKDLKYIEADQYEDLLNLADEVGKMLNGLIGRL
ncbi:four helix bundle protein [Proteinivorax tanatarense]|uniref:Four helix bundle protein n=1 Tax=Proteinivorax tanatarense TaxID=1260629 RepID=A0AAU7VHD6_9FIRM